MVCSHIRMNKGRKTEVYGTRRGRKKKLKILWSHIRMNKGRKTEVYGARRDKQKKLKMTWSPN